MLVKNASIFRAVDRKIESFYQMNAPIVSASLVSRTTFKLLLLNDILLSVVQGQLVMVGVVKTVSSCASNPKILHTSGFTSAMKNL